MNPFMQQLNPYPFARLRALMRDVQVSEHLNPIMLQIGEPKHATPQVIQDALVQNLDGLSKYPASKGIDALRESCSAWLKRRYDILVDANTQILPVNGSREALFSFVQVVLDAQSVEKPVVISPNPFYQIYEGATFLAGGEVEYVNCEAPNFMPDWKTIDTATWQRTQLVFVCSPGNPSGAVMQLEDWQELFALQDQYGFVIASDECYSEIYFGDNAPLGSLQAASMLGRSWDDLVMFTSLSKRSNVPGLRSGFVAGDAKWMAAFLEYRTYHGSAMGISVQHASIAAWNDEKHVEENRALYQQKFEQVVALLQDAYEVSIPDASFYIWLKVPDGDDARFAQRLWAEQAVQVLPGHLLARDTVHGNPGAGYIRIALVANVDECVEAAKRLLTFAQSFA
ncbi:succinyldiaminopimelate transaminase [Vitreoscilla sp. C1]|uniref:succinyldiaminopimelate transaminase n=1 Tax=Vitreoscilla sp. (strain C1) TaxID=96942 RepID=UPI00148EC746|nr:succinyldiaminopimelate transaminase [Vitreoscilla sp. C1]AUZ04693.2 succinyldiaminopimelate transaminase [Vitreoscilla sp. C1]